MVGLQRIDYSRPRLMLQCRSQYLYLAPPCLNVQRQFPTRGRAGVSVQRLSSTGARLSPCCYAQLPTEDTATSVRCATSLCSTSLCGPHPCPTPASAHSLNILIPSHLSQAPSGAPNRVCGYFISQCASLCSQHLKNIAKVA